VAAAAAVTGELAVALAGVPGRGGAFPEIAATIHGATGRFTVTGFITGPVKLPVIPGADVVLLDATMGAVKGKNGACGWDSEG
jgi:hypothetical protein